MKAMLASLFVCAFACFAPAAESERQVGLFYFLWLGEHGRKGPWDVSKILADDPDAGQKPDGPMWGPWGAYHHWGEPLYGYYFSDDDAANPPRTAKRYRCFADSAIPRDHVGYGTNYVNRTQRNAPEWIEVSHDAESVAFRVKTQKPIIGKDGEGDFMRILVNGKVVNALGEMKIDGNAMTLKVTRKALGISQGGAFRFDFKFIDSTEPCRDPLDWYDHGVVEPLGRVPFVYKGE